MARKSSVEKNNKRIRLANKHSKKREELKLVIMNKETPIEERFIALKKIDALPKNSSKVRKRNRCNLTGRPRGYYRKFGISRIALRQLANLGLIPGVKKSSW